MKTFRFWSRASELVQTPDREWNIECYGGSDTSLEEALLRAQERVRAVASAVSQGRDPDHYAYSSRPLREEIVEELQHQGETAALLTRNSYGALILNTARVLFADIDYEDDYDREPHANRPPGFLIQLVQFVARLLGKEAPEWARDTATEQPSAETSQDEQIVNRVRFVTERHAGLGVRLYRTANGFRCLVTSGTWDPLATVTTSLLEQLGSDPLYMTLCRGQECFRARLSPKPWRCEVPPAPSRFPWRNDAAEQEHRRWVAKYERATAGYSTCAFIGAFGESNVDPAVEPILRLHDELACTGEGPIA